jgi:putative oxidoreductase
MNLLGRFFYALPFMIFSIFYFRNAGTVMEVMPQWMPGGEIWVYISAVIYAFASTSILVLKKTRIACILLGCVLLVTAFIVHFPNLSNNDLATLSMTNLLKDFSLAGAAFYFATTMRPDRERLPGIKRRGKADGRRKL